MIATVYLLVGVTLSFLASTRLFGGDSAEFSTIAHTWSIPHPPGYPFYSLLLNIVTHALPYGTIPWRASLLSVIPTVLTSFIIFKILSRLQVNKFISLLSSLIYIVLFPVWEYALVPEAFALNSFFVMFITYLLLSYHLKQNKNYLYLSALILGICVSHHHIFVIFIPGWFFLIKPYIYKLYKDKKMFLFCGLLFILGLSFYLYAPIASYFNPPLQWEDAKSLNGFYRLITRAVYGSFTAYGGSKGDFVNQLYDIFSIFVFIFHDFRIIGSLIVGFGIISTIRIKNIFFSFLSTTSIFHIFFLFYTNFLLYNSFSIGMYERFLISFYSILIIYFALGFHYLYKTCSTYVSKKSNKKILQSFVSLCAFIFLIIYGAILAITNFRSISYIKNGRDFDRLGLDIIHTVPDGGIYFVNTDNANFATLYHVIENKNDKSIFFQINLAYQKFYFNKFKRVNTSLKYPTTMNDTGDLKKFINLNKDRGVYLEFPQDYGFWMPYGLLWKYYESKEDGLKDIDAILERNTYLWNSVYHIPELNKYQLNIMHLQTILDYYVDSYLNYSKLLFLSKNYATTELILKNILKTYRPSNKLIKITLMNLYVYENKCKEAGNIANGFLNYTIESLPIEALNSMREYFIKCYPRDPRGSLFEKYIEKTNKKSLTPLNSF